MVFVKVRETYDLHTVKNKMSVIAIHTPDSKIIKANFPGLLMQCKAYRPASCDVRIACASVLPVDPLGVGLAEGDVAPEDLFNPILYKACSNFGMSQIEARVRAMNGQNSGVDVAGNSAIVEADSFTDRADEFKIYYGLLSNAHEWKHANPQSGLEMRNLKPLVYEMLYSAGDNPLTYPATDGTQATATPVQFRGNSKPMPMINCTSYTGSGVRPGFNVGNSAGTEFIGNNETEVPSPKIVCGCIIIPPSRLHELFYRMVVEWTLEFSMIRPVSEIVNWNGLEVFADLTHYQNYDYSQTKQALTGDSDSILDSDTSLASANVDIKKVM
jgi:hypothetical protein